jgi:hypothetical protein
LHSCETSFMLWLSSRTSCSSTTWILIDSQNTNQYDIVYSISKTQ